MKFSLNFPSNILFGENIIEKLGEEVRDLGKKCIVVTGAKSTKKTGTLNRVILNLKKYDIDSIVFDHIQKEPNTDIVDEARELAEKESVDFIIGLGGGSALDVAKATAGLYGLNLSTSKYLNKEPFNYKGIPFVAIPTTAGTGSEITLNSVLYNPVTGNKNSLAHPKFQAILSIVDPTLTYSMPPYITSATGMDALTHAIESYTSKEANPVTMALAGEAIKLIGRNIVKVVENGMDKEGRSNMALGSTIAALAFAQTGVGVAHSISHPMGAIFHISHGVANAILLPEVINFNYESCRDRYDRIAELLGGDKSASEQVRNILNKLPIPHSLMEAGYKHGKENEVIDKTFQSRSLKKNPREVKKTDVLEIINKCL